MIAPIKSVIIPRLGLLSTLLLAQLMSNVYFILSTNLPIAQVMCLMDSAIVLCWIQNLKKQFKQYVKNCVTKIRELTNIES